ncbi:response regulator [Leptolyngbya ohadii]|uniref:response regulator n=1 Tax=Leptolyngbya ohadii TaxID=1962290 RepID=UPI000B5991C9|nr:response regulator [Leptolyngbya ohadii]
MTNLVKDLRRKLRSAGIQDEVIETLYGLGYRLKALPSPEESEQEGKKASRSKKILREDTPNESPKDVQQDEDSGLDAIAQRFRSTLGERLTYLDAALEALQRQQIEPQQRQQAQEEAHQLAGTLGFFGYGERADLMRSIEQVLQQGGTVPESKRIFQLRGALKQFASGTELVEQSSQSRQQRWMPVSSGASLSWEPRWGNLVAGKVAIVDDDALALAAIQQILQPWGFQVMGFTDPEQFWQQLPTLQVDLVLLDLLMPRLGGIELCQRIRQHPTCGDLPVLIVTAHPDEISIRQLFAAGADDFVSKPVVGPELVTRVSSRLQRRDNLHP